MSIEDFDKNFKWSDDELLSVYKYKADECVKLGEEYQKLLIARRRCR